MAVLLILLGLVVLGLLIWVWYLIAQEFYRVAERKGFDERKYLWLTFLLGVIGILLVVALPDRGVQNVVMPYGQASEAKTAVLSDELPDL